MKGSVQKELVMISIALVTVLAGAPWVTDDFATARVVEELGGENTPFTYLGVTMPVRDVQKDLVRIPFGALVYFPSEAMFIVTFFGVVL